MGRQARQNCFLLLFCCSCPSVLSLRLEQIAYLAQVSPFRSRPYLLSFIGQEQPVPCSATRNTSLRLTSVSFGLTPSPDTTSLASRILTSRPTYAEKLQGYKNLSPRFNTLPLAGHANTSVLTFAVPKKNLIHVFSGHWPLFLPFFVDILAIFALPRRLSLRIRHSAPELCPMHLKNVVSARPEQTCIFHRLTRLLCCPVACIYNMPNKIPKRRFFAKNFKNIFLRLPVLFLCTKKGDHLVSF